MKAREPGAAPDRIALLINSLGSGGAERVVTVLIQQLRKAGGAVELICLERTAFFSLPDDAPVSFLSSAGGREPFWLKLVLLVVYALRLKRLVRRKNLRIVQSHLNRANYVNALARVLGSRHRVQLVNCQRMSINREQGLPGRINLLLIGWLFPKADLIVAKSEGMRQDIESILGDRVPVTVVHNPYPLQNIRRLAGEETAEPWMLPPNRVVLSVGRLISLKRLPDTLRAFAAVARCHPELQLAFLGSGEERARLEELSAALGIESRVHFTGNVANPFKYMRRSSCLVLSSSSEGFPNVLVESMICGCPVVASDCVSGPREILAPGTPPEARLYAGFAEEAAGILYAVGDVPALTEALSLVIERPERAQRLAEAGRKRVLSFSQGIIVEKYRELLRA